MNIEDEPSVFVLIKGRVLDINEESAVRLRESTGFANDVLARAEEDVWNGV